MIQFRPRLLDSLRGYNRTRLLQDVSAGLTVGVVALPLAMAFAIASGVKPENGIFTAIIAGFIISALGGSKVQIGGPAGAFIVIIYGIIERYGLANLLICTIMAGVLLFAMGLLRLGNLIRFIPVPIVIGFTNGIAVLIALSQLKDFFGLQVENVPADFFSKLQVLAAHSESLSPPTLAIGLASLVLVVLWPKSYQPQDANYKKWLTVWLTKVPGTIIALVLATLFVASTGVNVETIGSRFGGVPQALPSFAFPHFSWSLVKQLVAPTITIALLCAIESLLCARVADNMINASHKDRHDPNQELMAQGMANFIAPFFGGIPATGTIARTVTNVRSGATSPVAGIVHALTLLLVILLAAPLAYHVPLASLAAILLYVAWNMGEWREFARLRQFSLPYGTVLVSTFLLTVIFDLTVAVEVGLVLASLFFIYRVSNLTTIERIANPNQTDHSNVEIYQVYGSLFFGAVTKLENLFSPQATLPKVVILDLHQTISIDTTGLEALAGLHHQLHVQGCHLILCGLNKQPGSIIRRGGLVQEIGPDHVCATLEEALALANSLQ